MVDYVFVVTLNSSWSWLTSVAEISEQNRSQGHYDLEKNHQYIEENIEAETEIG